MAQDIREVMYKYLFGNCFMHLKGSLDIFRKSHKVSATKFDSFPVKLRIESNIGYYGPGMFITVILTPFRGQSDKWLKVI